MDTPEVPAGSSPAPDEQPEAGRVRKGKSRTSPLQRFVQAALTLLLLYLIFGVVLPQIADWGEVWDAIQELSGLDILILAGCFVLIEFLKGAEQAVAIKPLPVGKAVVASEASTAISNVIPGPSGTGMRLYIYRTWGLTSSDFARGWLLTSIVNNAIILFFPSIALAIYAAQGDVSGKLIALAVLGAVLSIAFIAIAAGMFRSERFAKRVGVLGGRLATWARGVVHRPSTTDIAAVIVRFRTETLETVRETGFKLVAVILLKYLANGATLLFALRAVGVPRDPLTIAGCFAAYSLVRLATVVEITPGGVGVVEVAYTAALSYVTADAYHAEIVAGVLLFRVVTYIAPIPAGALAYLLWRQKRSWRVAPGVEDPGELAVVSAMIDEHPPRE
jgi:uncharacterized protein (TIRG00374 family)